MLKQGGLPGSKWLAPLLPTRPAAGSQYRLLHLTRTPGTRKHSSRWCCSGLSPGQGAVKSFSPRRAAVLLTYTGALSDFKCRGRLCTWLSLSHRGEHIVTRRCLWLCVFSTLSLVAGDGCDGGHMCMLQPWGTGMGTVHPPWGPCGGPGSRNWLLLATKRVWCENHPSCSLHGLSVLCCPP